MDLSEEVVIVTGGNSGIGAGIASYMTATMIFIDGEMNIQNPGL